MRKLLIYTDTSVIGGCEDEIYAEASLALWSRFVGGQHNLVLSAHTLRELKDAPDSVQKRIGDIPADNIAVLPDNTQAAELAEAYLKRGIGGPGSRSDALHIALATVGRVDVLVSWNFRHIVNLGRIRQFHAVSIEHGYGLLEIRTPREVIDYEE
jgi:hypothetical protein